MQMVAWSSRGSAEREGAAGVNWGTENLGKTFCHCPGEESGQCLPTALAVRLPKVGAKWCLKRELIPFLSTPGLLCLDKTGQCLLSLEMISHNPEKLINSVSHKLLLVSEWILKPWSRTGGWCLQLPF